MATPSATPVLSPQEAYRLWARTFDTERNPMLSLERRYLKPLLPCAHGLDILDMGCGTGRWLEILKTEAPHSLLGLDPSSEMLHKAKIKLKTAATLQCIDAVSAPLAQRSADLILGNFVLSYIEDAAALLTNAGRALRETGSLILTDVHPETTIALQWQRGIRSEMGFQKIQVYERPIELVIAQCESVGLQLRARLEPCFGENEKGLFAAAGKAQYWEQANDYPAIYILQFQPRSRASVQCPSKNEEASVSKILNATISVGPEARIRGTLCISDARITALGVDSGSPAPTSNSAIDLNGFLLLPGLINAHDHLEFALFPRLGAGEYANALEWAEDIHRRDAAVIANHRKVPKDVRLWWGGIRNLLCGATTVSHHNPYDSDLFENNFPVRVVRDYGWAHSLPLASDVPEKKRQTPPNQPFIIHLGEGIDQASAEEITQLHRAGGLDENTVLVHGLALNKKGQSLLRKSGAGLIWCPSTNVFLFGRTLDSEFIDSLSKVAIGSDSPLTAEGDLLDEVRFASAISRLNATKIYDFVTRQSARLLQLRAGHGALCVGGTADLIAVRDSRRSPAETLTELSCVDVELVLIAGRVHLASEELFMRLPENTRSGLELILVDGVSRWVRAPIKNLFRQTIPHLPDGIFLGGRRVSLGVQ